MITIYQWSFAVKLFSVLGCGLVAGIFFAFSTFVMKALAHLQPAQGITAMQSINITVINPWFLVAFFGTAVTCLLLTISSLLKWHQPGAVFLLIGSLLYLIGTVLVTIAFNVPLNDALAIANPNSPESADLWARYLTNWTVWNHVRTIAALAAATLLTIALCNQTVT
ncbi:MAG: DUF1772 domain-containing protein [Leptolyngbyaceae cyanobacterium RM2_2_4]|nr:DUF1772 domain-containing protein [Leptolyngbyaceae cyanobacterium SM1_4_3]NJN89881.1 DUF1772 domain-containing protein [Leptolyngbyaceae cyanobacterium SL_5_14]NJO48736.1 DUF1772 domain-containing protein [Leptolyngbyaceae cyanobacterium RM2_2_4]